MTLKHQLMILTTIFIAGTFALAAEKSAQAPGHDHGHNSHENATSTEATRNKKWDADQALQRRMNEIRSTVQSKMKVAHAGKLQSADYKLLAEKIDESILSAFKECKLAPEADAALHKIFARMMKGTAAMKGEAKDRSELSRQGFTEVVKALEDYPRVFNDPTWVPLSH